MPQIKPEPATAVARLQSEAAPQAASAGLSTRLDSFPAAPAAVPMHEAHSDSSKYYLTIEDYIEAAPSIGSKTAALLEALGLISVRD